MSCSEFELYELYDKFGEEAEEREGGRYGERCCEPPPTTVFFSAATGVTGNSAGDTWSINQTEVALRPGVVGEGNLIRSLLPPAFTQECRKQAQESFDELMQHIARRELPVGDGTKGGFQEIVKRTAGRYEMLYKMDQGLLEADPSGQLGKVLADTWLQPFLNRTIGPGWRLMRQALLVSFPGATVQQWHVDGGHISNARHLPCHAMNVFIALDEISLDMGPTELRPASHFLSRDLSKQMFLAKIKKRLHPTLKPECQPGDAVIFDYRTLHRGLPNDSAATASAHDGLQQKLWADGMLWGGDDGDSGDRSWTGKARPMLELTFANERYNDLLNFPPKSVFG